MLTARIQSLPDHLSLSPYQPYPTGHDRGFWNRLPKEIRETLIRTGEAYLNTDYQPLKASDFMEYTRKGNRVRYEDILFGKRIQFNHLVLAECVEYKGRFLDDIINGIFSICEETAWQLPAHNTYVRDTPALPLPDTRRPVLDLFAAETGAVLATALYLLGEKLSKVSPTICAMVEDALNERIFRPYLEVHFWWMGDPFSHMNNWTAWCTQNVLLAAALTHQPPKRLKEMVKKSAKSLDYFLDEYGEDGCCDEGAQYYRHAALCLFQAMDIINTLTGGALTSCFHHTKIQNMAAYLVNVHVKGPYYINFADCSPIAGRCNAREFLFGRMTNQPALTAFAASDYRESEDPLLQSEHSLFYRLQSIFTAAELQKFPTEPTVPRDMFYESAGVFLARDPIYCLAVKAGDNDDSHNHNDTGSFTIYKNGRPMLIDVGVESYTRQTFSPERYEIWTMQSRYHNLPSFQGIIQSPGAQYKAHDVTWEFLPDRSQISMDLAAAYDDDRIQSYCRTAVLHKGSHIAITDWARTEGLETVLSLMTCEKPFWKENTLEIGTLGTCHIEGAAAVTVEEIPITDKRLKQAWPHSIYRCLVALEQDFLRLTIR